MDPPLNHSLFIVPFDFEGYDLNQAPYFDLYMSSFAKTQISALCCAVNPQNRSTQLFIKAMAIHPRLPLELEA